jgi:hypothetical protein
MKLPPLSTKRSSCSWATFSSLSVPNVIVPRQNVDTIVPVLPSVRYSI